MEIQKIFSDQYDDERLYSVLLTEDEMALYQYMFSEEEEQPKKKMSAGNKAAIASGATTAALTAASIAAGKGKLGGSAQEAVGKAVRKAGNLVRSSKLANSGAEMMGEGRFRKTISREMKKSMDKGAYNKLAKGAGRRFARDVKNADYKEMAKEAERISKIKALPAHK